MSKVFGSKKAPPIAKAPPPLPPAPTRTDAETEGLAEEQRRRVVSPNASGRASTFLTAGGVDKATSAVRFLGGSTGT